MKMGIGVLLAFAAGAACRAFGLPAPAPPSMFGVLLIAATTLGYMTVGYLR
jgi:XapX domain-containing protein